MQRYGRIQHEQQHSNLCYSLSLLLARCCFPSTGRKDIHDRRYLPSAIRTLTLLTPNPNHNHNRRTRGRKIAWSRSNCPSLGAENIIYALIVFGYFVCFCSVSWFFCVRLSVQYKCSLAREN